MKRFFIYCLALMGSLGLAQSQQNGLTTMGGVPIGDNQNSLTVGQDGPVLLEDIHLVEKLAAFDRERIPERVVHARGVGAYGEFEASGDFSQYTKAKFLSAKGKKTPMFVRLSTVIGSKGSPETVRDPRGFALRFYTEEGNYDIVGNHTPIFFIRDAIKFPDMVHSLKPSPIYNKQDPNRYFDFFANSPESISMLTLLYTDFGIPANYRQIPGSSVHAFKWVNAKGEVKYVKYFWESNQGQKFLTPEEAEKIQGKDFQHATVDFYQNIEKGNFPSWTLYVQMLDPKDLNNFDFNPLDATKIWPDQIAPKIQIGKFTINRVPDNFFEEVEQAGVDPGNLVPGIEASEDKLLQGRLFSYFDTQRHRIGPNYQSLPVNAPRVMVKNYYQDGYMSNRRKGKSELNYEPNESPQSYKENHAYRHSKHTINATVMQSMLSKPNNYGQARERYNSLTEMEKQHLVHNLTLDLAMVKNPVIRNKMIAHFYLVDPDFGKRLAAELKVSREEIEKQAMSMKH